MSTDDLPDLNAALGFLRDVTVSKLSRKHDVTVTQLNHITVRINIDDDQRFTIWAVGFQPVREIVEIRPLLHPLDLTFDRSLSLDLDLDPCPWQCAFRDLNCFEVEVCREPCQAFDSNATNGNLLDQLLVVRIQCVKAMYLGVLDLVSCGVPKHHQRVESRQRRQ